MATPRPPPSPPPSQHPKVYKRFSRNFLFCLFVTLPFCLFWAGNTLCFGLVWIVRWLVCCCCLPGGRCIRGVVEAWHTLTLHIQPSMPAAEEPPPALPPCPLRVRAAKMDFRGFPHTAAWWDTATAQREGCVQQARIDIVGNLQSCMDLLPNGNLFVRKQSGVGDGSRVRAGDSAGPCQQQRHPFSSVTRVTGACGYNRPCAHQYVGKSQSCMV